MIPLTLPSPQRGEGETQPSLKGGEVKFGFLSPAGGEDKGEGGYGVTVKRRRPMSWPETVLTSTV